MKIELKNNLPKYMSVVCCIVLYIVTFLTSSVIFPNNKELFLLNFIFSTLFLLSFYVTTSFLSTNKVFCTIFSSYFFVILCLYVATMLYTGKGQFWLENIVTIIFYPLFVPLLPTLVYIVGKINIPPTNEAEDLAMCVLIVAVCFLFYVVCFTSRYIRKRKLNGK